MKKILQAVDGASPKKPAEGSNDMKKFMRIVEGKGNLNRLTQAESIIIQEPSTKTITSPVLNISKDAKPSMIGKYFKTIQEELLEAEERSKDRASMIAQRVTERVMPKDDGTFTPSFGQQMSQTPAKPAGGNVIPKATVVLGGKEYRVNLEGDLRGRYSPGPDVPRVTAQGYIEGDVITLTINPPKMQEGVAGPQQCWPGHRKVGTKPGTGKNAGKRVNDCEKIKGK